MKVSFGKILYECELREKTFRQAANEDVIYNVIKPYKEFSSGRPLVSFLKDKLKADIVISHVKDGNTIVKLKNCASVKHPPVENINEMVRPFVINPKMPLVSVLSGIEDYLNKSIEIAKTCIRRK